MCGYNKSLNSIAFLLNDKKLLKVKHPMSPSVRPLVGRLVGMSVIISSKDGKFHFYAPIVALVCLFLSTKVNENLSMILYF